MSDDDFEPRPRGGRGPGGGDGKKTLRYLARVTVASRLAATGVRGRGRHFDGSRIGRGAGLARVLGSGDRLAGSRGRRAVVKTRLVRLGGRGFSAARAHLRYIQRDGVTREGAAGELYGPSDDIVDGQAFLARCDGDRHQFRFIVSGEDGDTYDDLKPFVRRLMVQAEHDLETRLDWVAVDHFNTGHPHSHITLRGVDDRGANLVIAREYIAHGLRARAAELATLDLGPRTTLEIETRLRAEIGAERLTAIDRRLLARMDDDRVVTPFDRDPFQQTLAAGRLKKLATMGLADPLDQGRYRLAAGLDDTLRRLSERGDIVRLMQRAMTAHNLDRAGVDRVITASDSAPIIGRVVERGIADELRDRQYLIVDGVDARVHYVSIGRGDATGPTPRGSVVRVSARDNAARAVDHTIVEVAGAQGGLYSVERHLQHDRSATAYFAETHVRRLEAMRRAGAGVGRDPDGSWRIAPDHIERVVAFTRRQACDRPVDVEMLSAGPLDRLEKAQAATWLDRELDAEVPVPLRDAGFGREVRSALAVRRQWLIAQELADGDRDCVRLRAGALATLQRRELLRVAIGLSEELGLDFAETPRSGRVGGLLGRRVELHSGSFAVVQKAREFSLVPWRPVLDKRVGTSVEGIVRGDRVTWHLGRARSGPEID